MNTLKFFILLLLGLTLIASSASALVVPNDELALLDKTYSDVAPHDGNILEKRSGLVPSGEREPYENCFICEVYFLKTDKVLQGSRCAHVIHKKCLNHERKKRFACMYCGLKTRN